MLRVLALETGEEVGRVKLVDRRPRWPGIDEAETAALTFDDGEPAIARVVRVWHAVDNGLFVGATQVARDPLEAEC
jgi:hypothetical protein